MNSTMNYKETINWLFQQLPMYQRIGKAAYKSNLQTTIELLKQLKSNIGNTGTVLTWNMSYEKGCNQRMAELYPEYADFLKNLNERIQDLMTPFKNLWFIDKDFF